MQRRVKGVFVLGLVLGLGATAPAQAGETTERVSVGLDGRQGNGSSFGPSLSANGRFVAFSSQATNLVPSDTNGELDVFVRDRKRGKTERVSVSSGGRQGNESSSIAAQAISADGRFVAFDSDATNLVPRDTNGVGDVFVHNRETGRTSRVSVGQGGVQGNGFSEGVAISANGRFVAFASGATNLVPRDTNREEDVFIRDRKEGTTERVSIASSGAQGNGDSHGGLALSANGRFIAFTSDATNLVPDDTNDARDLFVHDRVTGKTERVSVSSDGVQGNRFSESPALSANGRFVAFYSAATNLVPGDTNDANDAFVHDRKTGKTIRVSISSGGVQANENSFDATLSADGQAVAFDSRATNLVPNDTNDTTDVFVRDR